MYINFSIKDHLYKIFTSTTVTSKSQYVMCIPCVCTYVSTHTSTQNT